jgi:hypothetical protein
MRKILSGFLIFVMFAATLMCFCAPEAQAGVSQGYTHANHNDDADHHHGKGDAPDCKGVDIQLPQQANIAAPDLKPALYLDFAFVSDVPSWAPVLTADNAIRGPPPGWPEHSQAQPSILLTTQRLRI